jgi:hypothetical protein
MLASSAWQICCNLASVSVDREKIRFTEGSLRPMRLPNAAYVTPRDFNSRFRLSMIRLASPLVCVLISIPS